MLGDDMRMCERLRKRTMFWQALCGVASVSAMTVFFALLNEVDNSTRSSSHSPVVALVLAGIVALGCWAMAVSCKSKYCAATKKAFLTGAFQRRFDELVYEPEQGYTKEQVEATELVAEGNRFDSDDLMTGSHHGARFTRADVRIQYHRSSGKSSSTTTYFRGWWLIFDFHKRFRSDFQIRDRAFSYPRKHEGFWHELWHGKSRFHAWSAVDGAFDQSFSVYAVDDDQADAILSEPMKQAILGLRHELGGELLMAFQGEELHVAVHTDENALEPPVWGAIDPEALARTADQQADLIVRVIEALELDRTLFV